MKFFLKLVIGLLLIGLLPNALWIALLCAGAIGTALHTLFSEPVSALAEFLIGTGGLLFFVVYCWALWRIGMDTAKSIGASLRRSDAKTKRPPF